MKRKTLLFLSVIFFTVLAACSSAAPSSTTGQVDQEQPEQSSPSGSQPEPQSAADIRLSIGTAGVGGTFYPIGGAISDIVNNYVDGYSMSTELTGGSVENIRRMHLDELDFGLSSTIEASAYLGVEDFEGDPQNVRTVFAMYPVHWQLVTLANSDINSFEDLRGKSVAIGDPGSAVNNTMVTMLEAYDMTMDDIKPVFLGADKGAEGVASGQIDAVFNGVALPSPFVLNLQATKDIKIIPIPEEKVGKIREINPSITVTPMPIPAGTYEGIDEDIPVMGVYTQMLTKKNMPDEVVYNTLKGIMENLDHIVKVHSIAKFITLEAAGTQATIPYHPGAAKYFEEQGITIPDSLKPVD